MIGNRVRPDVFAGVLWNSSLLRLCEAWMEANHGNRKFDCARSWLRLIVDHNPFFLLSGLCMLFGCYLLNGGTTRAGDVGKLVILLLVINAYEAMIIPLGLTLIRRGEFFKRNGRMLLVLELLFLIDITFTNGVISTVDARWGWLIASTSCLSSRPSNWGSFSASYDCRTPSASARWRCCKSPCSCRCPRSINRSR